MTTNKNGFTRLFAVLAIALLFTPAFAQAQEVIGRIVRTSGVVTGVSLTGDERPLARGSNVLIDETITTGPRGSTQMRLADGALITLNENSFFTVDDFEYDGEGGADDTVIMTMLRGTMRTITGVIGDAPGDTYSMNTPFASIGVRGTDYVVIVEPNGRVRVFVTDGSISVAPLIPGGIPVIAGLEGDSDALEVDGATAVRELTDAEIDAIPGLRDSINSIRVDPVSEEDINRLPDDSVAVQVEVSRQNQQQAVIDANGNPLRNAAGLLVDADGNPLPATTETEVFQARQVIVITVNQRQPDSFDASTVVSPNR